MEREHAWGGEKAHRGRGDVGAAHPANLRQNTPHPPTTPPTSPPPLRTPHIFTPASPLPCTPLPQVNDPWWNTNPEDKDALQGRIQCHPHPHPHSHPHPHPHSQVNNPWWNTNPEDKDALHGRIRELLFQIQYSPHDTIVVVGHSHFFRSMFQVSIRFLIFRIRMISMIGISHSTPTSSDRCSRRAPSPPRPRPPHSTPPLHTAHPHTPIHTLHSQPHPPIHSASCMRTSPTARPNSPRVSARTFCPTAE